VAILTGAVAKSFVEGRVDADAAEVELEVDAAAADILIELRAVRARLDAVEAAIMRSPRGNPR
jgi:DNA-binding FrmR family transcriptional regulator